MATGERDPVRPRLRQDVRRVIAAGSVAGGLGLAFWLIEDIGAQSHAFANLSCVQQPWGCPGLVLIAVMAGLVAVVLLAWPLLDMAGVRPAWLRCT